jgi:SAM-dependent methyltransferase
MNDRNPIALKAYEALAERFSKIAEAKAENGYIEYPAIRKQIGNVKGLNILEAGCGPGYLSEYLTAQGAQMTAFDVSPKMLEIANKRNPYQRFFNADMAEPLNFAQDEEFDMVVSSLAIDYVKDWTVPMSEFHRVLKPKGRLVFSVQHPLGSFAWYKPQTAFGVQYAEAVWADFGGEPVVVPDYYRSFEEIINPVIAAGFTLKGIVETRPVDKLKEVDPDKFEKLSRQATFMVIEAVKNSTN